MNWVFLDVATVQSLQAQQIERFGGAHGLRDPGHLESTVSRPEKTANYDPTSTAGSLAASLSWGLIKNHAFIDGNKRIGLASAVVFLKLNGYVMTASTSEQVSMVLKVATSEISEQDWTGWLDGNIAPSS